MSTFRKKSLMFGAGTLWLLLIGAGWVVLTDYTSRPAPIGNVPVVWPSESMLQHYKDHMTLVLFAHPRCPCTRTSIHELERLMAQTTGRLSAHVVFFQPVEAAPSWASSDTWDYASTLSGVTVHRDPDAREATRFGALASGQVIVFDPDGQRRFVDGITAGRGHEGSNPGQRAILDYDRTGIASRDTSPVFGCLIQDPRRSADS